MRNLRPDWFPSLLACLIYAPALWLGLTWDDHFLIPPLQDSGLSPARLLQPYWTGPEGAAGQGVAYSRPLVTLSFSLQLALHGLSPSWLHAFNVGLHALNSGLLALLLAGLVGSSRAAVPAAILWAVWPTQVEAVAWISGRTDLMAMCGGLLAWLAWRRAVGLDGWALVTAGCLFGALLCKEVAWVFVLLLPWLPAVPGASTPDEPGLESSLEAPRWLRWSPPLIAAFLAWAVRAAALGEQTLPSWTDAGPLWAIPLRMAASAGHYLEMLLWPWNPSALPAHRALPPPTSPGLWLGGLSLLAWPLLLGWTWRRQHLPLTLALAWTGVGLLPVLNAVPLAAPSPVAERFWYVPLGGVALGVALCLSTVRGTSGGPAWSPPGRIGRLSRLLEVALLLLTVLATATSFRRIPDWQDDRTLWEAELERHGLRHPLAARNLGQARKLEGDRAGAMEVWRHALETGLGGGTPSYFECGVGLAEALLDSRQPQDALRLLEPLLALDPPAVQRERLEALQRAAVLAAGLHGHLPPATHPSKKANPGPY